MLEDLRMSLLVDPQIWNGRPLRLAGFHDFYEITTCFMICIRPRQ